MLSTQAIWMIFYENINEHNRNKKLKIWSYLIENILDNEKLQPIRAELFVRTRRLNIFLIFITQPFFTLPKNIDSDFTQYFIIEISNKQEFQQIAPNHSSSINLKYFMKVYQKCTAKPYSFLVNNIALQSDNLFFLDAIFQKEYKK